MIKKILYNLKLNLYCRFFHKRWRCYSEVGGDGLKGSWHCSKCNPCGDVFDILLKNKGKNE